MHRQDKTGKHAGNRLWHRVLYALTFPVYKYAALLALFFAMTAVVLAIVFFAGVWPSDHKHFINFVLIFSDSFVTAYAIVLSGEWLNRLRRWMSVIWLVLWGIILSINFLIDATFFLVYNTLCTPETLCAIVATNAREALEFIDRYINSSVILGIVVFVAIFAAIYYVVKIACRKKVGIDSRTGRIVFLLLAIASAIFSISMPGIQHVNCTPLLKIYTLRHLDTGHELEPSGTEIAIAGKDSPTQIVVIIGESHARTHSQLYGYQVATQPEQVKLRDNGSLYVFANPQAPALYTLAAMSRLIGVWDGEECGKEWYRSLTFIEAARKGGYQTVWLSNQPSKGILDMSVQKIAHSCDQWQFTSQDIATLLHPLYDQSLFPLIKSHLQAKRKTLTVIHLMGSHVGYESRYPQKWQKFALNDYTGDEYHRFILAGYDNSVLYNDFILTEIYKIYDPTDAIVIYLSDHGQDIFDSAPDYAGHGRNYDHKSSIAGLQIPFTVYLTEKFKCAHPALANRIAKASQTADSIRTTDLIYTLMDVMGEKIPGKDIVAERSFFTTP